MGHRVLHCKVRAYFLLLQVYYAQTLSLFLGTAGFITKLYLTDLCHVIIEYDFHIAKLVEFFSSQNTLFRVYLYHQAIYGLGIYCIKGVIVAERGAFVAVEVCCEPSEVRFFNVEVS